MSIWLLLSGILAPALFWIGYFAYKDRFRPEPAVKLGVAYLLGIASAILCLGVLTGLSMLGIEVDPSGWMESERLHFLIHSILVTGLTEELCKFLPFLLIVRKFREFDETIDGVIYAAVIALGFASYENMYYLRDMAGFEMFGRAFASPLTHTIFSSLWGFAVGSAYLKGKSLWRAGLTGLSAAAVLHGVFNFLTTSPTLRIIGAAVILIIWIGRIWILERSPRKPVFSTKRK